MTFDYAGQLSWTQAAEHAAVGQLLSTSNISGGAGKNLTVLTGHSELAGEPLFMRVSEVSENLTFS